MRILAFRSERGEYWDQQGTNKVEYALEVARTYVTGEPPRPDSGEHGTARLPFPALVVASDDDLHLRLERARELAGGWGSQLEVIPGAGHLNTASGYGPWPQGESLLADLCRRISARAGSSMLVGSVCNPLDPQRL